MMSTFTIHDTYAGHTDGAEFSAEDGHEFIEIWQRKSTAERVVRDGSLNHDALSKWLNCPTVTKDEICSTRLLISKPVDSVAPGRRRYPVTLAVLEHVVASLEIPLPFINAMASQTTLAMDYGTVHDGELPNAADPKRTGVIFILGPIALAISYNAATKLTTGLVLGLCDHQAAKLMDNMRKVSGVTQVPMLLAAILLNVLGETRAHRVIGRKRAINGMEVELGINWGVQGGLRIQSMGLEIATRQLTVYGSEVAWDLHAIEAQLEMVALIEEVQGSINGHSSTLDDEFLALAAFRARTRRIRQVLSGLMHWTRYNQQRVQLQTIYSYVSQRDNDISYRTAVASQRIAEATQRDGVLMKQLAAQSKALALRTWRDGVDMRAMAVVTLITLHGTFTATLFSTSFFNFQPTGSNQQVSSWIWLYFVVTAAFTALCLSGWYYSSRKMAEAAKKDPADGYVYKNEKADDSDASMQQQIRTSGGHQDAQDSPPALPNNSGKPSHFDRPPDPLEEEGTPKSDEAEPAAFPPRSRLTALNSSIIDSPPPQPVNNLPPARAYWDASDIWGTQSYSRSGRACAMCAQHIEEHN